MSARAWRRTGFAALWVAAMAAVGLGTYAILGSTRRSHAIKAAMVPSNTTPAFRLPGKLYLAHNGGIYRMQDGVFTELQASNGWMQPSISPDGRKLVAVRRAGVNFSDMYALDPVSGQVQAPLTNNASGAVELNHWSFYPRYTPDGLNMVFSWDSPKDYTYKVDLAVWSVPVGAPLSRAVQWTVPNDYTGGDVSPVPTKDGGILYVKYDVSPEGKSFSQVWATSRAKAPGHALTQPADSCAQPAISPDGSRLAMICSADQRSSRLVVAPFDGNALGEPRTLIEGQIVAAPTWSPDGTSLVYMAPGSASGAGHFQLWHLQVPPPALPATAEPASPAPTSSPSGARPATAPPSPTPTPGPRQVTSNLDFDALSPPVWVS